MALIFASTNKVYGGIEHEPVALAGTRYVHSGLPKGVPESCSLDFHSPYGCSKGAADQYVRDYARIYGLRTVVFRQSCIYGPRQFGFEEQGWVAWFAIAAATGAKITIYGDGCQVRDLLWVDDLCDLYTRAIERIDDVAGKVFNVGGGPENVASVRDVLEILEELLGRTIPAANGPWRPGDQRVFVADTRSICEALDWKPRVTPTEGVRQLNEWINSSREVVESVLGMARA